MKLGNRLLTECLIRERYSVYYCEYFLDTRIPNKIGIDVWGAISSVCFKVRANVMGFFK